MPDIRRSHRQRLVAFFAIATAATAGFFQLTPMLVAVAWAALFLALMLSWPELWQRAGEIPRQWRALGDDAHARRVWWELVRIIAAAACWAGVAVISAWALGHLTRWIWFKFTY